MRHCRAAKISTEAWGAARERAFRWKGERAAAPRLPCPLSERMAARVKRSIAKREKCAALVRVSHAKARAKVAVSLVWARTARVKRSIAKGEKCAALVRAPHAKVRAKVAVSLSWTRTARKKRSAARGGKFAARGSGRKSVRVRCFYSRKGKNMLGLLAGPGIFC